MRNFAEIINDLQSGGFSLDKNKYIDSITNVPLLILDDLGIERDTSYAKEQVYNVINARYQKQKPTIITTNLSFETIENTKEMEYQRIYSRIIEMCIPVVVVGQDYRKKIKSHKDKATRK
jgi:DNA replication protein DnaC